MGRPNETKREKIMPAREYALTMKNASRLAVLYYYSIDMRNQAHVYACRKAAGDGIRRRISRAILILQKRAAFLRSAAGGI
jgi:hypothetical protein